MAPTVNDIELYVRFMPHQLAHIYGDVHKHLNNAYGGEIKNMDPLFEDNNPRTTPVNNVIARIRASIVEELIVPNAIHTGGDDDDDEDEIAAIVRPYINEAPLKCSITQNVNYRLTERAHLVKIMERAIAANKTQVFIDVSINRMHFRLGTGHPDVLNWNDIAKTAFTGADAPQAAPTATDIATATANAVTAVMQQQQRQQPGETWRAQGSLHAVGFYSPARTIPTSMVPEGRAVGDRRATPARITP